MIPRSVQTVVLILLALALVADLLGVYVLPGHQPNVVIDGGILTILGGAFAASRGPKPGAPPAVGPPAEQLPDDDDEPPKVGRHYRGVS